MGLNLSQNEKRLVIATAFLVVFMFYWYVLLNPIITNIDVKSKDITNAQNQLKIVNSNPSVAMLSASAEVLTQDKQNSLILNFINSKVSAYKINLLSINESAGEGIITLNLKLLSSYDAMSAFIDSFKELKTLIVIDNVDVTVQQNKVQTTLKMRSVYK
jgi:type II secretory pathway component PulM